MKVIILDRDGVINQDSEDYIKSPDEWVPIRGSLESIARLSNAGFKVVVVTNQSGIGRGYYTEETLYRIHGKMSRLLESVGGEIDRIYFCPHQDEDLCNCRKPKPGLFHQVAKDYNIDLSKVFYIGDSYRDHEAAKAAGCQFILVMTGYGVMTLEAHPELKETADIKIFNDLLEATAYILR